MNPLRPDLFLYFLEKAREIDPENPEQAFADMVRQQTLYDVSLFLGALGYSDASGIIYGAYNGTVNMSHYMKDTSENLRKY